jgi:hypothetical protein
MAVKIHTSRALSRPLQHLLDLVFFAKIPLADEIDLQAVIPGEALSVPRSLFRSGSAKRA